MKIIKKLIRSVAAQLPEREVTKTLPDFKIRLLTSQSLDFKVLCGLSHGPGAVAAIKRLVTPGMIAIDVGANIGWITLHLAARVGPSGRVVAFEPSDWTYGRLTNNIRLNSFTWVEVVRAAVGAAPNGDVELMLPRGYRLDGQDTAARQRVPIVTLDEAVGKLTRIDFIKSDTDGCEPGVFEGARVILERHRPLLLFEVAPYHAQRAGFSLEKLFSDLSKLRYRFESLAGQAIDPIAEIAAITFNDSIDVVARADRR
jgi:FkbM family methyltransferase